MGFCSNEPSAHSYISNCIYFRHTFVCFFSRVCVYVSLAPSLFISIRHPIWNTVFLGRMNICHNAHFHLSIFFFLPRYIYGYYYVHSSVCHPHSLPYSLFSISVLFIISTFFPVFTFNKFHFIEWQKNKKGKLNKTKNPLFFRRKRKRMYREISKHHLYLKKRKRWVEITWHFFFSHILLLICCCQCVGICVECKWLLVTFADEWTWTCL